MTCKLTVSGSALYSWGMRNTSISFCEHFVSILHTMLNQCSPEAVRRLSHKAGPRGAAAAHLEEGALRALPPQGLGAGLVLAVLLIHLEILPLQGKARHGQVTLGAPSCQASTHTVCFHLCCQL